MARIVLLFLIGSLFLVSCFDAPELPDEPEISLKSYQFKYAEDDDFSDSLIVEINFKDGDGDLGLTSYDTLPPYKEFDIVEDENGDPIHYEQGNPDLPPFNCINYFFTPWRKVDGKNIRDTLWVERNDNHWNFFLEILVEQENGEFQRYNFLEERCVAGFYGRFFPLNTSGKERPLEGILRYGVQSGLRQLFGGETIKLRISIQDRALNRSNVVESEEIQIEA